MPGSNLLTASRGLNAIAPGALADDTVQRLNRLVRRGFGALAVLVLGLGGLAALLPMAGAVICPGEVSVETQVKEISHPEGGVAAAILVKDGDRVRKGQALLRLDTRVSGAAAASAGLTLDQLLAREARLRTVAQGRATIAFPSVLAARAAEPEARAAMADERAALALERQARSDQSRQLLARIAQSRAEIASFTGQAAAGERQRALVGQELSQARDLFADRLATLDRLNALERAAVGIDAQVGAARAGAEQARARIGDLRAQLAALSSTARSEAALELAQVQTQIAQVRKDDAAARERVDRSVIRAPVSGVVDKLAVRTLGSAVPAGQPLMELVPDRDRLVVKAQVRPTDVDAVARGQVAHLRFTALDARTTPEIAGRVERVAADRSTDRATGQSYYVVTISIADAELAKLEDARISVGMPVETFIRTRQRTLLQYIIRPLSDQLARALRE